MKALIFVACLFLCLKFNLSLKCLTSTQNYDNGYQCLNKNDKYCFKFEYTSLENVDEVQMKKGCESELTEFQCIVSFNRPMFAIFLIYFLEH